MLFTFNLPDSIAKNFEQEHLDSYYRGLFIGEKKTQNYHGPLDPRSTFDDENGDLWLLDDQFSNHYLNNEIQPDALSLHEFWFKKVKEKSICPDLVLGENLDYIRYLYRLLSISYLFESMKINHKASQELGFKNICSLNFKDVLGDCKPQSVDMNKFYDRVYGKFANEISKINVTALSKKDIALWIDGLQRSTSLTIDPVYSRLYDWCLAKKKSCKNVSLDEIKNALSAFCASDGELIQKLCSEKDSLFGVSYSEKATELIQSSNAFKLINQNGMGEDCLRRYVKIFSPKEIQYGILNKQFPLIFSKLTREGSRYLQGELFLPGALKEFDMKGLNDFLAALKPPKAEPVALLIPKPKMKPKPIPKPVVTKVVAVPKPESVPMVIVDPPKPKVSEFERAVSERESKNLETLSISMDKFRDDFEFSAQMINDLSSPIKKFQTRSALNDMKSFDKLGSAEAPVGLIFLKYLIDTDNHQGLFNIISVLGEKFYVSNDLEKIERPVFIELRNDTSTKNHWQIIICKSQKK